MIPRKLHTIWIGDESRRPDNCIRTWVEHHPGWEVKVWGNAELQDRAWTNSRHMARMATRELCGVADLMRWEILLSEGGVAVDADSVCLRPLADWLLEAEAFACWENEIVRPGLIATVCLGFEPGNPFVGRIISDVRQEQSIVDRRAWQSVGPLRLSESYFKYQYTPLTIYPSHFFIPRHFAAAPYTGRGPVFSDQLWGSTYGSYEGLHQAELRPWSAPASQPENVANSSETFLRPVHLRDRCAP